MAMATENLCALRWAWARQARLVMNPCETLDSQQINDMR